MAKWIIKTQEQKIKVEGLNGNKKVTKKGKGTWRSYKKNARCSLICELHEKTQMCAEEVVESFWERQEERRSEDYKSVV